MLPFSEPAKLKTKKIVFEEIYNTIDAETLEHLKEMSCKRKSIEEALNASSTAKEGRSISRIEHELRSVEEYLPLLVNLVSHVKLRGYGTSYSKLEIRWISALSPSNPLKLSPKPCHFNDLLVELGMSLFLYGAILRERGLEITTTDLAQASTLYRKAAGVYTYLADELLPPLQPALPKDKIPEVTPCLASVMSDICLAEAQIVTTKRAQEKGTSPGLLAKLHYGVKVLLDQASTTLRSSNSQKKIITSRLEDYINSCGALHELRSESYVAESYKADSQLGFAIGVVRRALHNVKGKMPSNESWRVIFKKEIDDNGAMLKKLERENEFIAYDKIPSLLPALEGKQIVNAISYSPQRCETNLEIVRFCN
ncbi:hypothetical protein ACHQM5_005767 [Ranunculus cassubicifolius]